MKEGRINYFFIGVRADLLEVKATNVDVNPFKHGHPKRYVTYTYECIYIGAFRVQSLRLKIFMIWSTTFFFLLKNPVPRYIVSPGCEKYVPVLPLAVWWGPESEDTACRIGRYLL